MGMGRRGDRGQVQPLVIATADLPESPGHVFYDRLNELLEAEGFDEFVEGVCQRHYASQGRSGRPSLPPGTYFRLLFVGYFEAIDTQRGLCWRARDSLSIREFLGLRLTERTPDHSTLTRIRQRLPESVFEEVFGFLLQVAERRGLFSAPERTVAVDATTLEANASMKAIVRRDTREDWKAYLKRLMKDEGVVRQDEDPTDEDIRRFDKARKGKKVSNKDWESPSDPDARIMRMKDGRTHLGYKAEHVVDLENGLVLGPMISPGDYGDTQTFVDSLCTAQMHLDQASQSGTRRVRIRDVVADKGYHSAVGLELAASLGQRTYVPEPKRQHPWNWEEHSEAERKAVQLNRRRVRGRRGKRLQRQRSERVERSFAHSCETGGGRRSWLRGLVNVTKRYLAQMTGYNLGVIMRHLVGIGKPRVLQSKERWAKTLPHVNSCNEHPAVGFT